MMMFVTAVMWGDLHAALTRAEVVTNRAIEKIGKLEDLRKQMIEERQKETAE